MRNVAGEELRRFEAIVPDAPQVKGMLKGWLSSHKATGRAKIMNGCTQFDEGEQCYEINEDTGTWGLCEIDVCGGGGDDGGDGDDPWPEEDGGGQDQCNPLIEFCDEPGGGGDSGDSGGNGTSGCDPNAINPPEGCEQPDPCEEPNPPVWCTNKCVTGDTIIDNTSVQEIFEDQWEKSNANAIDLNDRLEQGGWLIEDPISGRIGFQEFPSEWTRLPCKIQLPSSITIPINTVGILHTHPFQLGEKMYSCANVSQSMYQQFQQQFDSVVKNYDGNPSSGDVSLIEQINDASHQTIKAYLIDGNGITEYDESSDPNDINTSNRHERCGF